MAVSKGVTTRSSEKIVLPVDADRTTVVLAQEPAPPHITHTHADCTPTQLDREPATPLLTPTPADSNPVPIDIAPSPPQSTQTRAVSKATAVPKARGPPLQTPTQYLKQKKNCSQVRFRSYGSYYFALASLIYSYQLISNLKDAIETPMAQQVCFKPVSSTCLAVCYCNLLYVDFSFN